MSGIIGLYHFDTSACEHLNLGRMAAALDRGIRKDGEEWGFHVAGPVGLGRTLLRSTPEDQFEDQPLRAPGLVLVADARLDNRPELYKAFNIDPLLAPRLPDSVLVLRAYQRWGDESPQYLLGDFVFIVWDERQRKLFCARDHRGKRPLFYLHTARMLAMASAPRGLVALPSVSARLDESSFATFLVGAGNPSSTFYEGIHRLLPAHSLTASAAGILVRQYWFPGALQQLKLRSDVEYLEAFREVFSEAVHCRLRSAGPVGALLTGGLDSSSVACVAARHMQGVGRLPTFTAVPEHGTPAPAWGDWYPDETPLVEAIREYQGNIDPEYVRSEESFLDGLEQFFVMMGAPVGNTVNRLWMEKILRNAHSRGIRVLLHGQEGNRWISYGGHNRLAELAQTRRWIALFRECRALAGTGKTQSAVSTAGRTIAASLVPETLWIRHRRWQLGEEPWRAYSPVNPALAAEIQLSEQYFYSPTSPVRRWTDGRKHRLVHANATAALLDSDCYSALRSGYGVDMRDPTADKRVVEFCLSLPSEQFFRDGCDRLLVRRGMAGILPPAVLHNTKRGLQDADWHLRLSAGRHEISHELARLERSETARRCLDLPRMRQLAAAWPTGNWSDKRVFNDYLCVLMNGVSAGRFIRWMESGQV